MLVFVLICLTLCPFCFAIILTRMRELVALLEFASLFLVTVNVLWLSTVLWVPNMASEI